MRSCSHLLLLLGIFVVGAQAVDTVWVRTYHHYGEDRPYDMNVDEAGNVYLAGFRIGQGTGWDFLCLKYRPNGDTAWARSYDGQDAKLWSVDVDRAGNVYAAGFSNVVGELDYTTVKYDSTGTELWLRKYERGAQTNDHGTALCVDDSGYCYVTGDCYNGPEPIDGATIKYRPNGDTVWVRHGPGPDNENTDIAVDSAGNVYVTGRCYDGLPGFWTAKYRPNGDTAWVRRNYWAMNGAAPSCLALAADGVAVCGYRYDAGWNCDVAVIKYSPDGESLWADTVDGGWHEYDQAFDVAAGPAGSVYVTGTAGTGSCVYLMTVKYAADGTREWAIRYGDTLDYRSDWPCGIATDSLGNCYVCAHSMSDQDGDCILTVKYAPDGNELWHTAYRRRDGTDACGLALLGDYVYVAGTGQFPGNYWDCVTIKYDQTLGIDAAPNVEVQMTKYLPTIVRGVLFLPRDMTEIRPGISDRVPRHALLDISGRKVMTLKPGENDVSRLAPGVYFVSERTFRAACRVTTKIVIHH